MIDQYNRPIDYLRVSLIDVCNLNCSYCMPDSGYIAHNKRLKQEDLLRIMRQAVALGIKKIKLTGGEPLLYPNLVGLIQQIKKIKGIEEVTLTTNGVLLLKHLEVLVQAGLDGINVSLDTLQPKRFLQLTKKDVLQDVLDGIQKAKDLGMKKIKINTVLIKGINEDELFDLTDYAKSNKLPIRFIELMPIGCGKSFEGVDKAVILTALQRRYGELISCEDALGNGPATYYQTQDHTLKLGLISAISNTFCSACNRVRLTCEGYLKLCLHYDIGVDLKPYIEDEKTLQEVMAKAIYTKPQKHKFNEKTDENSHVDTRKMVQIGG